MWIGFGEEIPPHCLIEPKRRKKDSCPVLMLLSASLCLCLPPLCMFRWRCHTEGLPVWVLTCRYSQFKTDVYLCLYPFSLLLCAGGGRVASVKPSTPPTLSWERAGRASLMGMPRAFAGLGLGCFLLSPNRGSRNEKGFMFFFFWIYVLFSDFHLWSLLVLFSC